MKKEMSRKLKQARVLSVLIVLLGIVLLIFMITVEDEPGALPLFLIIVGTASLMINRYQIKKERALAAKSKPV